MNKWKIKILSVSLVGLIGLFNFGFAGAETGADVLFSTPDLMGQKASLFVQRQITIRASDLVANANAKANVSTVIAREPQKPEAKFSLSKGLVVIFALVFLILVRARLGA